MADMRSLFASLALTCAICACALAQDPSAAPPAPAPPVPAYHTSPPPKGATLPPIMTRDQLTILGLTEPARIESYEAAAKIPEVFYQMPCYCYCDRGHGHSSLRSCFVSFR